MGSPADRGAAAKNSQSCQACSSLKGLIFRHSIFRPYIYGSVNLPSC